MANGKLIVVDGGDGSGKTTQTKLLMDYLQQSGKTAKYMDFPQYYNSFYGETVAKFLRGEFGKIDEISPYLASLPFALDRASVKDEMDTFLQSGGTIVANRYATSNMAHQAARFSDPHEQQAFLEWVEELEYKVHKIPKEDIVVYLHVPWEIGRELSHKRGAPKYLKGKEDILEKDTEHRIAAEKMYKDLAVKKNWATIPCVVDGNLLSEQEIHSKIIAVLKEKGLV